MEIKKEVSRMQNRKKIALNIKCCSGKKCSEKNPLDLMNRLLIYWAVEGETTFHWFECECQTKK